MILKFNVWIFFAIWVNWQLCTLQRDAVGKKNLAPVNHSKPTPGWEPHFALKVPVCSSKRTSCQPFTSEWKTYQTIRANSKHLWQHKTTTWRQRCFFFLCYGQCGRPPRAQSMCALQKTKQTKQNSFYWPFLRRVSGVGPELPLLRHQTCCWELWIQVVCVSEEVGGIPGYTTQTVSK